MANNDEVKDSNITWNSGSLGVQTSSVYYPNLNVKSVLVINGGTMYVNSMKERPCWWFRLWQFLLLGWRWQKV